MASFMRWTVVQKFFSIAKARASMQTNLSLPCTSSARLFSRDYYIRVTSADLQKLELLHLFSYVDPCVVQDAGGISGDGRAGVCAGSTEWHGPARTGQVSLAWDWVRHDDGHILALKRVAPRTNLHLLDHAGYDLSGKDHVAELWRFLDGFAWQRHVQTALGNAAFLL
jgi:Domain of unknown function (DUF4902)